MHLNNRGTSIVFAVFSLIVLSILGLTIFSLISTDAGTAASQMVSSRALFAAEAGWQIGAKAIKDDKDAAPQTSNPAANGYSGTVYFDGYHAAGASGSDYDRACFYKQNPMEGKNSEYPTIINPIPLGAEKYAAIWDFRQRVNMIGTRIKSARLVMRARRSGGGGSNPIVQIQYTTNGSAPSPTWTNVGSAVTLNSASWPQVDAYVDLTPAPSWSDIMDGSNFRIRVLRTNEGGSRNAQIDWLGLELTLECDTLTEPWGSGSYMTLPSALGNSNIQSITISDESGKIHLNYASGTLLENLMNELSITNAANKASAIVNYRNTVGWFNTIEGIQQISNPVSLDSGDFNLLKDYITVYPWVNQDVTRPTGNRAPININTASELVLRAVFRTISPPLGGTRPANLAREIVSERVSSPFTHMNSSKDFFDENLKSLAYYIESKNTIFGGGAPGTARMDSVREEADASDLNKTLVSSWNGNNVAGTEFSYYSHTFLIESTGRSGNIGRTVLQTYGNPNPTLALKTHINDISPKPYWREER